jgi:hypothetical protein
LHTCSHFFWSKRCGKTNWRSHRVGSRPLSMMPEILHMTAIWASRIFNQSTSSARFCGTSLHHYRLLPPLGIGGFHVVVRNGRGGCKMQTARS